MKNDNLKTILAELAEQTAPSSEINLWPALQAQLVANELQPGKRKLMMKQSSARTPLFRRIALAALTLAIALAVLLATPQGRAFAQSILRFFTRSASDTLVTPAEPVKWVNLTPGMPPATLTPLPTSTSFTLDCGDLRNPTCTVEQVRSQAGFTIKEPGNIPAGLYFLGATVEQDGTWLRYEAQAHSGGMSITEAPWTGKPLSPSPEIGASAIVEKVQIGNLAGEYVKGSFMTTSDNPVATWEVDAGIETLRWVDENVFYTLQHYSQTMLGKEGLVVVAESMTTEPVVKQPMPAPTAAATEASGSAAWLTIPQAEELAGFKLALPPQIPEFLAKIGASYDPENKVVNVWFNLDDVNMNGLYLSQQVAPNPNDCKLCGMLRGDKTVLEKDQFHMVVSPTADLETVQIGTLTGQYVEGHWIGSDCCGWVWTKEDLKTLRWWKDGMAFELIELGTGLTKADLIDIAQSLK